MGVIKPTIKTIFLGEKLKLNDDHLEECLHLPPLKQDDNDFQSHREIHNLLLNKLIATTNEPPRDSNSINIHNDTNKSSAVNINGDNRDVNNNY